ncbi:MAG: glycine zipper domain-containing protein [Candidatus Omnitrophota bacterium]|nr:glycine zipper domain-containing protein [Candidatus Omnitrophota bacterium]
MNRNRMSTGQAAGLAMIVGLAFTGCATSDGTGASSGAKTAGLGTLAGAGLGAIIGHQSGHTAEGALIGAGTGAVGGYILGNEKDKTQTQSQINAAQAQANTVIINVNNSNGSITPVTLTRQGNLYVGPRGEQYTSLPTEEQLRKIYGF